MLATLDSEPFMDMAPAQVYAKLLEDGEYLCSPRTMYRVLDAGPGQLTAHADRGSPMVTKWTAQLLCRPGRCEEPQPPADVE